MAEIESFVDADRGAQFLGISRRRLLQLARDGIVPAYPIGNGERKTWRFRLSEIVAAFRQVSDAEIQKRGMIDTGSPRRPNRRK